MNKRRILALIFILALLTLSLNGCGQKPVNLQIQAMPIITIQLTQPQFARGESAGYGAATARAMTV